MTTVRLVPPWRSRKARGVVRALLGLIVLWGGVAIATGVALDRAPVLRGHVVAARSFYRKSSLEYHIVYTYTDERGAEREDRRDLVASLARQQGFTTVGAPIEVKLILGQPFLQGAPNVFTAVPWIFAGMAAFMALIFFAVDRGEARKSKLALEGTLSRGRIDRVTAFSFRGSKSITIRYSFDGHAGKDKLATRAGPDSYLQLGLDRPPADGAVIWVAYDASDPKNSTIYSFGEEDAYSVPSGPLAPPPPGLTVDTPRALPPGAPGLSAGAVLAGVAFVVLAVGAGLYGAFQYAHADEALILVGGFIVTFLAAIGGPLFLDAVLDKRRILRTGAPLQAKILHAEFLGSKRLSVTFEARTPDGSFRGKERVERRRLERMGATPAVGDTIFLCHRPGRPWERAVWGFGKP